MSTQLKNFWYVNNDQYGISSDNISCSFLLQSEENECAKCFVKLSICILIYQNNNHTKGYKTNLDGKPNQIPICIDTLNTYNFWVAPCAYFTHYNEFGKPFHSCLVREKNSPNPNILANCHVNVVFCILMSDVFQ